MKSIPMAYRDREEYTISRYVLVLALIKNVCEFKGFGGEILWNLSTECEFDLPVSQMIVSDIDVPVHLIIRRREIKQELVHARKLTISVLVVPSVHFIVGWPLSRASS